MEYEAIKQELLKIKQELEIRLDETHKEITHADGPLEQDFAEQAVQRQGEEVTYGLDQSARIELIQVKKAIERIEKGAYGICAKCSEQIPIERLQAIPFTNFCRDCLGDCLNVIVVCAPVSTSRPAYEQHDQSYLPYKVT